MKVIIEGKIANTEVLQSCVVCESVGIYALYDGMLEDDQEIVFPYRLCGDCVKIGVIE